MLCITKIIQIYLEFVFITSKVDTHINDKAIDILNSNEVCFLTLWHGKIIVFPKIMRKFGIKTIGNFYNIRKKLIY